MPRLGAGADVTVKLVEPVIEPYVAEILVLPEPTAVTNPVALTVATFGLEDVHADAEVIS
jgi:hypothetical protein